MIRCAFCDSAMMALEINGTNAHVCPLCGRMIYCIGQSSKRKP